MQFRDFCAKKTAHRILRIPRKTSVQFRDFSAKKQLTEYTEYHEKLLCNSVTSVRKKTAHRILRIPRKTSVQFRDFSAKKTAHRIPRKAFVQS